MKANAPENLYFNKHTAQYNYERRNDDDIEYTRTDAFIEKAAKYLMDYEFNDSPTIADRRKRIEGFKKAMAI